MNVNLERPSATPVPYSNDHPLFGLEHKIDDLRECGRLFHFRGWSVGTSSNYSVLASRDPLQLVVTASGKDKGRLGPDDFVRIDADGLPTVPDQPKSSAETGLHTLLARLPNTGAILHTHSIWGTLLSDYYFEAGGFEIGGYEMLKGLSGQTTHDTKIWVPIFDNTQDIPHLAQEVKRRLDDTTLRPMQGFLIRNHGLYTWGSDVFSARRHVEIFEFLFEIVGRKTDFCRR